MQATGAKAIAIGSTTQATGANATAIGGSATASGDFSFSHGSSTTAQGTNSTAEGYGTTASGLSTHAEGSQTFAVGDYSHSQGYGTRANGYASSAEGNGTVANGANSSVSGMYNVPDSYTNWPDWAPNTDYAAGDKVHLPDEEPSDPRGEYFVCNTPHTSGTAWITYSFYWDSDNGKMNYAQIVGNGSNYLQQSNAYTLDWNGNGSYAGDVTINKGTADEVSVSELKTEINSRPEVENSTKTGVDFDVSDEDGNVIVRLKDGNIQTKEFDSATASDTRMSIKQGVDLDVSDEDGNVLLRLQNGHIKTKKFTSETLADRTTFVTVKASGGDFSTLRGAIDYINEQDDADPVEHPYVIQIYPGTYNVMEDYTDEEINTADVQDYHNGFVGPFLDDGVSLIGMGDRDSIILYGFLDSSNYVARVRGNISTLNTRGNVTLENLTVIAKNLRYCVHDDFSYPSSKGQYQRTVKNCRFIGENLSHTPACTWGGGMSGKGENAIFENCDFGTDFGFHFDASRSVHIYYRNCRGRKLRLAERAGSYHHYITIENSDIEMISLMRPSGVTTQHIFIEANGCEKTYVSSNDGDIILTGAITKGHLTNLPVGTLVRRVSTSGNGYEATSDPMTADGVIVANDDYYSYIQRTGYINTRILGMTSFNRGDYITIDGNDKLTTGGTASNAVGVISFISMDSDTVDQGIGFIKMLVGGME